MTHLTLAIAVIDCFIPESVPVVLEFAAEIDDETAKAALKCWAYYAECQLNGC